MIETLYYKPGARGQKGNIEMFRRIEARFPWMGFHKVDPEKAPWHIRGAIPCKGGGAIRIDFWPHTGKAVCLDMEPARLSAIGEEAIGSMIAKAIDQSQIDTEDFDVIETEVAEERDTPGRASPAL